ncbi:ankyrin repeat domain-containing protein [bacterium]|nr:ankyrin repeat domain-containing protein [bacterium]
MSALRSDFFPLFLYEVSKLEEPWKSMLTHLDTMSVEDIMKLIGNTTLVVSGVYVQGVQCTFEKISRRLHDTNVADFLMVLYGLVMSCANGELHSCLKDHMRPQWVSWMFTARVNSEPAFVLACRRSLKEMVEWMAHTMQEANDWSACAVQNASGDSALHIAVRRRQWDWAKWLLTHGASPYVKNHSGCSAIMLCAPHHEKLILFCGQKDMEWHSALHDALVYGRDDSSWCVALIDQGADVNQPELYDAPLDSLIVFAKNGMDMNLGPLPANRTPEQLKVFFVYGRKPSEWKHVIDAFEDVKWIKALRAFFQGEHASLPEEYKHHILERQGITKNTRDMVQRFESNK